MSSNATESFGHGGHLICPQIRTDEAGDGCIQMDRRVPVTKSLGHLINGACGMKGNLGCRALFRCCFSEQFLKL